MKKEPLILIGHIIENIEDIELFTKNTDEKKFLKNKEKQNAVIRSLEIIGETVKNIPQDVKINYPKIPWREIAGTRDKISYHYFGVDLELIWRLVKKNLPNLKNQMLKIKTDLSSAII